METIAYWASTAVFSFAMLLSGIGTLKSGKLIHDFKRLGFPDYFRKEVAISKILGAILLLIPFLPNFVRDWTYAGFLILLGSAIIAHLSVGDSKKSIALPLILLLIMIVSCYTFNHTS